MSLVAASDVERLQGFSWARGEGFTTVTVDACVVRVGDQVVKHYAYPWGDRVETVVRSEPGDGRHRYMDGDCSRDHWLLAFASEDSLEGHCHAQKVSLVVPA